MDNYCPECKCDLPLHAKKCSCGWEEKKQKAKGGIKCLCGRYARIQYDGYKCWDCYYAAIRGTDREDWRDKAVRENTRKMGLTLQDNEPEWAYNERARKMFQQLGGAAKLVGNKNAD